MPYVAGTDFVVLNEGSGRGTIRDKGSSAVECYLIAWPILAGFIEALKGGFRLNSPTSITYVVPYQHPDFPTFFVNQVEWEAIGKATGTYAWEYAKITATFGPFAFDPTTGNPSDAITEELNFDGKTVLIPAGGTVDSNNNPLIRPFAKFLPLCDYRVTLNSIPQLPGGDASLLLQLLGRVNSGTFRGAAAKKMLFQGARAYRTAASYSALNTTPWKLDLSYKYNDIGWDHGYDNKGALGVIKMADGSDIYPAANIGTPLPV
jgi:hypothetical protein